MGGQKLGQRIFYGVALGKLGFGIRRKPMLKDTAVVRFQIRREKMKLRGSQKSVAGLLGLKWVAQLGVV